MTIADRKLVALDDVRDVPYSEGATDTRLVTLDEVRDIPMPDDDPSTSEPNPFHVVESRPPVSQGATPVLDGEEFVFGESAELTPVWGTPAAPLWASGEGLMIAGPDGVGKTTLAQQLVRARLGLGSDLLGLAVVPDERPVLYLALDRPRQIARSLSRMVDDADRAALRERLKVWRGPLPEDIGTDRGELLLLDLAVAQGVGTVVLDSLKDAAVGLSDDVVGGRVNRAFQHLIAAGVEIVVLHHQRKGTADNRKPNRLQDVYGSRWLTAAMGSVLMVWGEAGDVVVDLTHLKQPLEIVGPLTVIHDHARGHTAVEAKPTIADLVAATRRGGLTVADAARQAYGGDGRSDVERARRALAKLFGSGRVERRDDPDGTARYFGLGEAA